MEADGRHRGDVPFLLKLSRQVMLKILASDRALQNKMTRRLWATGDSLIQTLIICASTDYTMRTCADWGCVSTFKCNCIRIGSIMQMPYTTSLSIRASPAPKNTSSRSYPQFSFSVADMLQLPPNLKQLQMCKVEGEVRWWNMQSNLIPHIPNVKNMLFLDIMCCFRQRDSACFSSFVNLKTLRIKLLNMIDDQSLLTNLPPTLTAFKCNDVSVSTELIAASLPRNLTALSICRWSILVPKLPHLKSLVFLRLKLVNYHDVLELPPNLEYFRTLILGKSDGIAENNISHTRWPESLTDVDVRLDCSWTRYCERYHKGLVYLRDVVTFDEESIAWSPLPFNNCNATLVVLNLRLRCKYDPDYFGLESLVALTHLELQLAVTTISSLDDGYAKMKLPCRLPPNLRFLKADLSYYLAEITCARLCIEQEDTAEKYPLLKQIALSIMYSDVNARSYGRISSAGRISAHVSLPKSSFPSLAHLNLRFNNYGLPYSPIVHFNTKSYTRKNASSNMWFNIQVSAKSQDQSQVGGELCIKVHNVENPPRPWEMKHYM